MTVARWVADSGMQILGWRLADAMLIREHSWDTWNGEEAALGRGGSWARGSLPESLTQPHRDLGLRWPSRIALSRGQGAGIYASVYNQSLHVGCFEKETWPWERQLPWAEETPKGADSWGLSPGNTSSSWGKCPSLLKRDLSGVTQHPQEWNTNTWREHSG